jgi:hypothetical protein
MTLIADSFDQSGEERDGHGVGEGIDKLKN